jgi:hypothetical protein
MPRSGSASYAGGASGLAVTAGAAGTPLSGTFNATADFGNATVTGGLAMNKVGANGVLTPYDSMSSGPITLSSGTSTFSGSAVTKTGTGATGGALFGPTAATTAGVFGAAGANTTVAGAFGGAKH